MKTFKQFIYEDNFKNPGFYLQRGGMPQIKQQNHFISHLNKLNISHETNIVNHFILKPTQSEYDNDKVESIVRLNQSTLDGVIASTDGYILDGHHRYLAAVRTHSLIKVLFVDLPINKLLRVAIDYNESNKDSYG